MENANRFLENGLENSKRIVWRHLVGLETLDRGLSERSRSWQPHPGGRRTGTQARPCQEQGRH